MINYQTLKNFLRVSRLSLELCSEINSEKTLQELTDDYSAGLSKKQTKILEHIKIMELELNGLPNLASVKRNMFKLEKLMGSKIPSQVFLNIN